MKMRKWFVSHLGCQIFTLENVGFSHREIQEKLKIKSNYTVSNAYLRYKNRNSYIPKKLLAGQKNLQKRRKKARDSVLKNPMVSLGKMGVHFKSFLTKKSITRQTVRKIPKKHGIRRRIQLKS